MMQIMRMKKLVKKVGSNKNEKQKKNTSESLVPVKTLNEQKQSI